MIKNLSQKYANITQESINLFKAGYIECQKKKRRPTTKGTVVRPILTKEFGTRGQVDLIDMQSMKGRFSWIVVYQDHLTKFIVLRPPTSKRAVEVTYQLLDIFLLFGAPHILQSDNGSEFTAQVIEELKVMWPSLIMVHGKLRHPQSQGSVERANADIKDMLTAWLADNETTDWTEQAVMAPGLDTSGSSLLDAATSLPVGPEEAGPLLLVFQDETSGSASLTPA
ncbi:KRAB-A domain-containing protein 2-like [Macrobrachium nipponense]|uniref:KRAB-A domain-containing protein 2-like n=1 Tax=Macrobrachium nipponense TaxID=159736 RepID=UPI0030C82BD4